MPADSFTIKQGDTLPVLRRTLYNADGSPINLVSATEVRFHMKKFSGVEKVNSGALVVSGIGGVVEYNWQTADTDTVGLYLSEFQVTFNSGDVITVPNDMDMQVRVVAQLA